MGRGREQVENGKVQECHTELEDALYLTGIGKFHYLLLLSCGIGLSGVMMETFGSSFLLPSAQCDFTLTSTDKGVLNALYPVGMIFGSHMWGYLADTKGRKTVLVTSLLSDAICAVLSSFAHAFWLLLVFRFICGFFVVGASSVIYAYLGEFLSAENRNKGLMWLSIFIGIGIGTQPGIAWLIIPQTWELYLPWCVYKSWRFFIVVCALPTLLSGLIIAFYFPETPKFLMSVGKKEETLHVLKHMYSTNTGSSPEKYSVKSVILVEDDATQIAVTGSESCIVNLIVHMWNQTAPLFKPPFLWKTLLACFVQYGLYASANGLSLWLPDIFNNEAMYYSIYPASRPSFCQIYNSVSVTQDIQSRNMFPLELKNPLSLNLLQNDTLTFFCVKESLILNVNNVTEMELNPIPNIMKCQNDILLHNLSEKSLQLDIQNEAITLTILNMTADRHFLQYETDKSSLVPQLIHKEECKSNVDLSAFQNTLITGAVSALSYICVGFLIGPLGKKPIIVLSLLLGGIAGLLLDYVTANWEFFVMALTFVTLSGMSVTVMVSAVVEIFPTNLRAMAVCISLMFGRLGCFTAHMLMGILLETNCVLMTYLLGGICTCCGFVSVFLPSSNKSNKYHNSN